MAYCTLRTSVLIFFLSGLSACGGSDYDQSVRLEDTYNQGYWDALDCVKRKGGSAFDAAEDCEDE